MSEEKKEKKSTSVFKNLYFTGLILSILVTILAFFISQTPYFEKTELQSIDTRFQKRGPELGFKERSNVIIIGIDDEAIDNLPGSYPFPRSYYGKVIENMNKAGAKAVGIDLLFDAIDTRNKDGDSTLRVILSKYKNAVLAGRQETETVSRGQYEMKSTDSLVFRNIFADIPGVNLGFVNVQPDQDGVYRKYIVSAELPNGESMSSLATSVFKYAKEIENYKKLEIKKIDDHFQFGEMKGNDFILQDSMSYPQWDSYSLQLNYYGPEKSFTYISMDKVMDDETIITKPERENIRILAEEMGMTAEQILADTTLYPQWAEDSFDDAYLASFDGSQPLGFRYSDTFKDKLVFVGSANPEDKDILNVPYRSGDQKSGTNLMYGVEIHATAAQNYIDHNFLRRLSNGTLLTLMFVFTYVIFLLTTGIKHLKVKNFLYLSVVNFVFIFGVVYTAINLLNDVGLIPLASMIPEFENPYFSAYFPLLYVFLIVIGILYYQHKKGGFDQELTAEFSNIIIVIISIYGVIELGQYLFESNLIMMRIVPVSASILLGYVGSIGYQYLTESKQKKVIKGIFSFYVNKEVVDKMLENPDSVKLGGEKLEMSVMFSDLSGFTTISEMLSPEDLVKLLNEYLGSMTDIIMAEGGTVDKYIGDAIMAFWGAPIHQPDHALKACRAIMKQQKRLHELQQGWIDKGYPKLVARFGLNTGNMVVGNMGSATRFNYTVMGDSVNLAARLEPANKEFETYVMISEFTQAKVKDEFLTRQLDLLQVKGKTKPVTVFELMADKSDEPNLQHLVSIATVYTEGLNLYYAQKWDEAIAKFHEVLTIEPNDGPSKTYIHRCEEFKENPPEAGWIGVYIMKHK